MKKLIFYISVILGIALMSCNKDKDPINTTPQSTVTAHKYYKSYTQSNPCFLKDTIVFYSSSELYNPWVGMTLIDPRFTLTGVLSSQNRYDYSIDVAPGNQNISGVWDWGNATATMDNDVFVSVKLTELTIPQIIQYVHTANYTKVN